MSRRCGGTLLPNAANRCNYKKNSARKRRRWNVLSFAGSGGKPIAPQRPVGLSTRAGRDGGRVHCDTTTMHDLRHHGRFDREFDRFDPVLPAAVKSQSQDGSTVYYNLTDLTDILLRGTCARVATLRTTASASLPRERIGQISQIGKNPFAVCRFSFDSPQSTVVKRQSKSGQTGGGAR